jgi:hypothetical protein
MDRPRRLRARGAVVVWVAGDPDVLPPMFRAVAGDAQVQPVLTLPLHLGVGVTQVGWALLRPQPVTRGGAEKYPGHPHAFDSGDP